MENKRVPEVRFAGFSGEWEEKKVEQLLKESLIPGSNGISAKKITVKLWGKGVIPKVEVYQGSNATKYYIRKAGQFIYGKLDFLNQAFGIIPNELDGYESTVDSPAFDIYDSVNPFFFLENVKREKFYLHYGTMANGSRKAKRIHVQTFYDMPLLVPNHDEQTQIGNFFKQLDERIALQQQELDTLKQTKQGFLQKMFPKEGEAVPEVRFPGFSGEWEESKFEDDIQQIQTGTSLLGSEDNEGIPLIKMGNIQRGYFTFNKIEYISSQHEVNPQDFANRGDFLFNTRNTLELVGKGATWFGLSGKYAFNSNIARFVFKNLDTVFFNYLYNTEKIINQVRSRAVGTTSVAAVYTRDLNSLEYYIPAVEEQAQIGNFFKQLDDTISLHEKELETLKETKKAFLQKMFV